MDTTNYLDLLNSQQRDAVEYTGGPELVIAGAGSGKTRVLTYKIVHLMALGIKPWEIMALTFTNKAANEMKERIAAVVGQKDASQIVMGTFHSVFLRILRRHASLLGYKRDFTIYDASDSLSLVKMIIRDMGLDDKIYRPNLVASIISSQKNSLISPEQYIADADNYKQDLKNKRPYLGEIYQRYVQRCKLADALDFDDILFQMNVLLRDHDEIAFEYGRRFKYFLVDEYQDTNFAQHLIITRLAEQHGKLCVVGDDAQSIYSFRGANIDNILNLDRRYPALKIFKLEQNYRSTQNIVNAAGSLICKNRRQMAKNVFSKNGEGDKVHIMQSFSDIEEAYLIASIITRLRHSYHDSLNNYAVLYRTNAQSRQIEEALRKRDMPYRVYGGLAFYQRKEVKDALSYLRLAVNPDDDEALKRIINYPARGIGDTTVKKIQTLAIEKGVSMWHVIDNPAEYALPVNAGTAKKLADFATLIHLFIKENGEKDAYEAGSFILRQTGILNLLKHDNTPESISRQENLQEVVNSLKSFVEEAQEEGSDAQNLSDYLAVVSLRTDQDEKENDQTPKVTLMTAHASKGLEFDHVIVSGLEEDLFPSEMARNSNAAIEEERRLLYVAVTRAKLTCHLTYAGSRFRNGRTTSMMPSRFLMDLDTAYIDVEGGAKTFRRVQDRYGYSPSPSFGRPANACHEKTGTQRFQGAFSTPSAPAPAKSIDPVNCDASLHTPDEVSEGQTILHPKFGEGQIVAVNREADPMIHVQFKETGLKKLLLRYAKFEIK